MSIKKNQDLEKSPLGKTSTFINTYTPDLLFAIPRKSKRDELGIGSELPFTGVDLWTGYELSWLNSKGKPVVAMGDFRVPCESTCLWESKSMKLYLNSFTGSKFESTEQVREIMLQDLSRLIGARVELGIYSLDQVSDKWAHINGLCLDGLDVECNQYMPNPQILKTLPGQAEEVFYTHLLKSNCLVTGQPDWGSVEIAYRGTRIDPVSLLQYIVSLRDHNEFHEQCVERIFTDIQKKCNPQWLSVYARYTRRGGLDINPYRVTAGSEVSWPKNLRVVRQ